MERVEAYHLSVADTKPELCKWKHDKVCYYHIGHDATETVFGFFEKSETQTSLFSYTD